MVIFDASFVLLLFDPDAGIPLDDQGDPVQKARARIETLIEELEKTRTVIGIPAPALSESLIRAKPSQIHRIVETIDKISAFRILTYDQRAAIEQAVMMGQELAGGTPKGDVETWAKLKFDRQILAIAKVAGATTIYSDDASLGKLAERHGMEVVRVGDLLVPDHLLQEELQFPGSVEALPSLLDEEE